jgi:hypothetical protein
MSLRDYQRTSALTLMASDAYGGRELLISGQSVRGKLSLISDVGSGKFNLTAINQQQWHLSVPYLSWLALGLEFPQAQSQLEVSGTELPPGFVAGVYAVVKVDGYDPSVIVTLERNF